MTVCHRYCSCQTVFLHPFYFQTTSGDDVKDFGRQLRNKITRKYRHQTQKKAYLPYSELQPEKR